MKVEARTRLRTITVQQWWFLAFAILFVLPFVILLAFQREVYNWYLAEFVEPELEEVLGFSGGHLEVTSPRGSFEAYTIITVTPNGIFDRAGVRPGDVPFGYAHGIQSGFLDHLHQARGETVNLRFVNRSELARGNTQERRISLIVPAKSAG